MAIRVSPFALATLGEVKRVLKLADSSPYRDDWIRRTINRVSSFIEGETGARFVAREYRKDFDGSGLATLWLDEYPILYVHTLLDDQNWDWSQTTDVIPRNSYFRDMNGESGGLRIYNERSAFSKGRNNIRVHWIGGWADLEIDWGENKFDFRERAAGTIYSVAIPPGRHDVFTVGSLIKTSMSSLGLNSYQALFDINTRKYSIYAITTTVATLMILASSGANASESILPTLGFSTLTDLTGATRYTPSTAISTPLIPDDVRLAAIELAVQRYDSSEFGTTAAANPGDVVSERIGEYSIEYSEGANRRSNTRIPRVVQETIDRYDRLYID